MRLKGRAMAGAALGGFVVSAEGGRRGTVHLPTVSPAAARRTVSR